MNKQKLLFILIFLPHMLFATQVTVKLSDIPDQKGGSILVAFCTIEQFLSDEKIPCKDYWKIVKVKPKKTHYDLVFKNVKPGEYIITGFQDLTGTKKLDKNWLGIPKEPVFFIVPLKLSVPKVENIKSTIKGKKQTIQLVKTEF